jgi:hypothetical protein
MNADHAVWPGRNPVETLPCCTFTWPLKPSGAQLLTLPSTENMPTASQRLATGLLHPSSWPLWHPALEPGIGTLLLMLRRAKADAVQRPQQLEQATTRALFTGAQRERAY